MLDFGRGAEAVTYGGGNPVPGGEYEFRKPWMFCRQCMDSVRERFYHRLNFAVEGIFWGIHHGLTRTKLGRALSVRFNNDGLELRSMTSKFP